MKKLLFILLIILLFSCSLYIPKYEVIGIYGWNKLYDPITDKAIELEINYAGKNYGIVPIHSICVIWEIDYHEIGNDFDAALLGYSIQIFDDFLEPQGESHVSGKSINLTRDRVLDDEIKIDNIIVYDILYSVDKN